MYLSIHLFHYIDGSSSELSSFFTNILTPKNIISIPTRTFNIFEILSGINCDSMVPSIATIDKNIKVAVMGCVVNGPGEAREADLGIAGGIGEGLLIKKGEIIRKVKEDELLDALRNELEHWGE